jgi:hypothetical protein
MPVPIRLSTKFLFNAILPAPKLLANGRQYLSVRGIGEIMGDLESVIVLGILWITGNYRCWIPHTISLLIG